MHASSTHLLALFGTCTHVSRTCMLQHACTPHLHAPVKCIPNMKFDLPIQVISMVILEAGTTKIVNGNIWQCWNRHPICKSHVDQDINLRGLHSICLLPSQWLLSVVFHVHSPVSGSFCKIWRGFSATYIIILTQKPLMRCVHYHSLNLWFWMTRTSILGK
jgi:hypothetical protein